MKNTFKKDLVELGFDYKKTVALLFLINIIVLALGVIGFIFSKNYLFILFVIILLIVANFLFFSYFSSLKRKKNEDKENELLILIGYFEIFISNNVNVYHSFQSILEYANEFNKKNIQTFLDSVDKDKTVQPFIDFASNYQNKIVQNLMLSIYQMVDEGEKNEKINQFTVLFSNIKRERKIMMIEQKKKSLDSMNVFPLIGSGIITIVLTFSLLIIIGGMIS